MRIVLATVMLTLIYAMALGSADAWDIALGAVLGLSICLAFQRFLFPEPAAALDDVLRRAIRFPRLALATAFEIVRGTFIVARIALAPRIPRNEGFVTIPDGRRSATGVVISGLINTLSPGSVLIDIDPEDGNWTIHAIDVSHPEALVDEIQEFYEDYQRPVWP